MFKKSLIAALVLGAGFATSAQAEIVETNAYDYFNETLGFSGAAQSTDQIWQLRKGVNGGLLPYEGPRSNENIARYEEYLYWYMGFVNADYNYKGYILGHPGSGANDESALWFVAPTDALYSFDVTTDTSAFTGSQIYSIYLNGVALSSQVMNSSVATFDREMELNEGDTLAFSINNHTGYSGDGFYMTASVSYDDGTTSDVSAPLVAGLGLSLAGIASLPRRRKK